jgi:hypothetical protein
MLPDPSQTFLLYEGVSIMKKFLALAAVAVMSIVGAFAFDLGSIQGTWQDTEWDGNWTFKADGTIVLSLASTGETVFTFTDSNIQQPHIAIEDEGLTLRFDCAATHRTYKFVKPADLSPELKMTIVRDWRKGEYRKTLKVVRN